MRYKWWQCERVVLRFSFVWLVCSFELFVIVLLKNTSWVLLKYPSCQGDRHCEGNKHLESSPLFPLTARFLGAHRSTPSSLATIRSEALLSKAISWSYLVRASLHCSRFFFVTEYVTSCCFPVSSMQLIDLGMYAIWANIIFSALRGKNIYLFSYFFDRGLNAGLVKEQNGGSLKLEAFRKAAEKGWQFACIYTNGFLL